MEVLGPITEATWPGCSTLPRFEQFVGSAATEVSGAQPGMNWLGDALGNPPLVQRPLATSDSGLPFLQRVLVWTPGNRHDAAALTDDPFFDSGDWLDPALETALALASREDLVHWVRGALRSGRHLSMDTLRSSASLGGAAAAHGPTGQRRDPPGQLPRSGVTSGVKPAVPAPAVPAPEVPAPGVPDTPEPPKSGSASGVQPEERGLRLCRCNGHCGSSSCASARCKYERGSKRRKTAGEQDMGSSQEEAPRTLTPTPMPGRYCQRAAIPFGDYCAGCNCERSGCEAQRYKALSAQSVDGRWCRRHAEIASHWAKKSSRHYVNAFGAWEIPHNWDRPLEFAVRCSYVFERMVPEDLVAFREFCGAQPDDLAQWSGKPGSAQWCWLALANRAKWPLAVRSLAKYLTDRPHMWRAANAEDFALGVIAMLHACDGKPMKSMHAQLSGNGYMHSTQGLVKLGKQAGLIKEYSKPPPVRAERGY